MQLRVSSPHSGLRFIPAGVWIPPSVARLNGPPGSRYPAIVAQYRPTFRGGLPETQVISRKLWPVTSPSADYGVDGRRLHGRHATKGRTQLVTDGTTVCQEHAPEKD